MCGIFGITENNKKLVRDMMHKCSHRGPDGRGVWSDEHVTLGHNLLAIAPQPTNKSQPFETDKGNVLCYNGEIFGLGAEIGISTQKLHVRGPMGLEALTCERYIVEGNGQIRE